VESWANLTEWIWVERLKKKRGVDGRIRGLGRRWRASFPQKLPD
jgi:hypothetical protein